MIITLIRVEGPSTQCGKAVTFETFERANSWLFSQSMTAPKGGGYDKCDFKIVDEATEFAYEGRYDLEHFGQKTIDLKGHCTGFLRFMGGSNKPRSMSEVRYATYLNQQVPSPARRKEYLDAADWLEKQP